MPFEEEDPASSDSELIAQEPSSNLDNYLAGYNISGFAEYPNPENDELLNAFLRGHNLHLFG